MSTRIDEIKSMLKHNDFNERKFIEIVSSIDSLPFIPIRYLKGRRVLRCRPNNIELFSSVKELSYPPSTYAELNRMSKEGQPMFYCSGFSISSNRTNCFPRIVNVLETCEEMRKGDSDGEVDLTIGNWIVKKDLRLLVMPLGSYERSFDEMKQIKRQFNLSKDSYTKDAVNFAKYMGYLISSERRSCLYEITSTFADYLLYKCPETKDYDGILYPSVQSAGEGVNICLKPDVADKSLELIGARKEKLVKRGKNSQLVDLLDADVDRHGNLIWGPIKH